MTSAVRIMKVYSACFEEIVDAIYCIYKLHGMAANQVDTKLLPKLIFHSLNKKQYAYKTLSKLQFPNVKEFKSV